MKQVLTLLAVLALIATVPGCDVGGGRGPSAEQLAEAQEIEQEFAPVRQEAQDFIREHEHRTDGPIAGRIVTLQGVLTSTERTVQALRNAPRDEWEEYKLAAEVAIDELREELEIAREDA